MTDQQHDRPDRSARRGSGRRGGASFPVTVVHDSTETRLEIAGRATLLAAGLAAGLPWPHGCKAGVCGACKSRLIEGQVQMLPHDSAALDDQEEAEGLILACCSRPVTACRVEWLGDSSLKMKERVWRGSVTEVEHLTPSIVRVRAEAPDASLFAFNAGQYARVSIGELPERDFSLANTPEELALEFHIRDMGTPVSSQIKSNAAVGQPVSVRGPFGTAHLREGDPHPLVCLGGGSGLAPIMSIVRTALLFGMTQPIAVYACARSREELYDLDRLATLAAQADNIHVHAVVSEQATGEDRSDKLLGFSMRQGFAHEVLAEDLQDLSAYTVHVCGPPMMVSAVMEFAKSAGCTRVFSDPFTPHQPPNGSHG